MSGTPSSEEIAPIAVNLNWKVKVRMMERGWAAFDAHHRALGLDIERYRAHYAPDVEGYSTFQLWELIHLIGPAVYMGPPTPIETTILVLPEA